MQAQATGRSEPPKEYRNVKVKGKIVGPDGKPVAGAKLSPRTVVVRQKGITTGPNGHFEFTAERILIDHFALGVEAPGLARKGVHAQGYRRGAGPAQARRRRRRYRPCAS